MQKIYFNNPNLHFAYCEDSQIGTIREAMICSMLMPNHSITIPKKRDFLIDDKYMI